MSLDRVAILQMHREILKTVDDWLAIRPISFAVQERERIAAANLAAYHRKKKSRAKKMPA